MVESTSGLRMRGEIMQGRRDVAMAREGKWRDQAPFSRLCQGAYAYAGLEGNDGIALQALGPTPFFQKACRWL